MTQPEVLWKPHPGAQTSFHARCEDVVLYGGSKGGGKTDSILFEALRQIHKPAYKALIVRRTFPQLQEVIDRAHNFYAKLGAKWVGDLHRYVFPSGAFVNFGHCQSEQDKERYQGHEYAFIGFDQLEQFLESQFNFIMAQNRSSDSDIQCYVRATANPGSVGHWWVKRRFIDNKRAGNTYSENYKLPDGRSITRTSAYIKATVYDNPTLLKANPTYLATLMSLPEIERRAYLDGDWAAFAVQCVFDSHGMQLQESKISEPMWIGYLREIQEKFQIVPDQKGELRIWHPPVSAADYLIGADVAEGDSTGDYSSAHVVDKRNWEVVAHWHGHRNAFEFAEILDHLGRHYDTAHIAVEVNGPGLATIEKLRERGYPSLYKYEKDKYGFRTTQHSRHNMITTLMDSIKDGSVMVRDRDTLDEMYNFIRAEGTGKIEAREGTNDDRVMSLGIALQCVRVNPFFEATSKGRSRSITIGSLTPPPRPIGGGHKRRTGY